MSNKQEIITKFARNEGDTGSPEVQCAILSDRIKQMTAHLKSNPKDFQSRHGLLRMVNSRRRLLSYLKKKDINRHQVLVQTLGIRA